MCRHTISSLHFRSNFIFDPCSLKWNLWRSSFYFPLDGWNTAEVSSPPKYGLGFCKFLGCLHISLRAFTFCLAYKSLLLHNLHWFTPGSNSIVSKPYYQGGSKASSDPKATHVCGSVGLDLSAKDSLTLDLRSFHWRMVQHSLRVPVCRFCLVWEKQHCSSSQATTCFPFWNLVVRRSNRVFNLGPSPSPSSDFWLT